MVIWPQLTNRVEQPEAETHDIDKSLHCVSIVLRALVYRHMDRRRSDDPVTFRRLLDAASAPRVASSSLIRVPICQRLVSAN